MTLPREIQKTKNFIRGFHAPHDVEAPIIHVSGLNARYESGPALVDVTFELKAGERVAVVGPNGAGKSTLFKVIAGVHPASCGRREDLRTRSGRAHLHRLSPPAQPGGLELSCDCRGCGDDGPDWEDRPLPVAKTRGLDICTAVSGRCRAGRPGRPANTRAVRRSAAAYVYCPGACPGSRAHAYG